MKIDKVYIPCCKSDFYLARICIASIRYWNNNIPVRLIKDYSKGDFSTSGIERFPDVEVIDYKIRNLSYYAKLVPFFQETNERILIADSDTVWMCDMAEILSGFDEDFIADGYAPPHTEAEMNRWFFRFPKLLEVFPGYNYPGFLFNVGHFACNTDCITVAELDKLLIWKENPEPRFGKLFFYEQGILNFIIAEKIKEKKITCRNVKLHKWGWDEEIASLTIQGIQERKGHPYLIHWYGQKNGLLRFLPGYRILKFYENYYFSLGNNPSLDSFLTGAGRIINHPFQFLYESAKLPYRTLKKYRHV